MYKQCDKLTMIAYQRRSECIPQVPIDIADRGQNADVGNTSIRKDINDKHIL